MRERVRGHILAYHMEKANVAAAGKGVPAGEKPYWECVYSALLHLSFNEFAPPSSGGRFSDTEAKRFAEDARAALALAYAQRQCARASGELSNPQSRWHPADLNAHRLTTLLAGVHYFSVVLGEPMNRFRFDESRIVHPPGE